LLAIREKFPRGQYPLRIEEGEFRLSDYRRFLAEHAAEIAAFRDTRSTAFNAELEYWKANGLLRLQEQESAVEQKHEEAVPEGLTALGSPASGSIWKIAVREGNAVEQGRTCIILESMKMEIEIKAPGDGVISRLLIKEGQTVHSGQALLWLEESA
jgi:urea carboxylase